MTSIPIKKFTGKIHDRIEEESASMGDFLETA